jgi:hypothetical protein
MDHAVGPQNYRFDVVCPDDHRENDVTPLRHGSRTCASRRPLVDEWLRAGGPTRIDRHTVSATHQIESHRASHGAKTNEAKLHLENAPLET